MKAPVWYLLERVSQVTGGDGYSRAYLIDVSVQHLSQWWLAGLAITETVDWFPYFNPLTGGADITNQFISYGLMAGLGAIALCLYLVTQSFRRLGEAMAELRSQSPEASESEFLLWGLGVMLAVHMVTWLGITYYDQFFVVWFMQLAVISGVTQRWIAAAPPAGAREAVDASEDPEARLAQAPLEPRRP